MRIVVQRSGHAKCIVDDKVVGEIDKGLMILVGFTSTDTLDDIEYFAKKIVNLRIFNDEFGVMNKSILDVCGSILSISQFTLYADTSRGNRPSYIKAMKSADAKVLYDRFNSELRKYISVQEGIFGADMKIEFTNDGPTTIILER